MKADKAYTAHVAALLFYAENERKNGKRTRVREGTAAITARDELHCESVRPPHGVRHVGGVLITSSRQMADRDGTREVGAVRRTAHPTGLR
jgi:hypothetical protein